MLQILRKRKHTSNTSRTHLITDYWILITPLILSGCMGVYEGGFECPPGKGLGCTSISEVNKVVDQCSGSSAQCSECKILDLRAPEDLHDSEKPQSHFTNPEIWYSPWFDSIQTEKRKVKVKDASISI